MTKGTLLLCFIDAIVRGEILAKTGIHNFIYMIESKIHETEAQPSISPPRGSFGEPNNEMFEAYLSLLKTIQQNDNCTMMFSASCIA